MSFYSSRWERSHPWSQDDIRFVRGATYKFTAGARAQNFDGLDVFALAAAMPRPLAAVMDRVVSTLQLRVAVPKWIAFLTALEDAYERVPVGRRRIADTLCAFEQLRTRSSTTRCTRRMSYKPCIACYSPHNSCREQLMWSYLRSSWLQGHMVREEELCREIVCALIRTRHATQMLGTSVEQTNSLSCAATASRCCTTISACAAAPWCATI